MYLPFLGQEAWKTMDEQAAVCIDRCTRMCKFKQQKICMVVYKGVLQQHAFTDAAWGLHHTSGSQSLLGMITQPCVSPATIDCAIIMHKHVSVYPLPQVVLDKQIESMAALRGSCRALSFATCHINICIICAIAGKGVRTPIRQCCETGKLSCVQCPPSTIVTISMLGVMLSICNTSFYLCPVCCSLRIWEGNGRDLECSTNECQCTQTTATEENGRRQRKQPFQAHSCMACGSKHVTRKAIILPDIENKCLRNCLLCVRHTPRDTLMQAVWDYDSLHRAMVVHPSRQK